MNRHPSSYLQSILAGTAEVEGSCIRDVMVGEGDKESALAVVEALDEVLTSPLCHSALRRECLVALPGICATYGVLPSSYLVGGHLIVDYQSTICVGGASVRRGTLDGLVVTVKSIPFNLTESPDGSQENAYREVVTWKNLNHRNVLPLLGVDASISSLSTISASMEYGDLRDYLVHFPNAERSKLLFDASRGLEYMHGLDCIHGDLKGSNILINSNRSAVLANFRLASFLSASEVDIGVSVSECDPCSVRWLAPELLFPEKFGLKSTRRTKETDIYAFAMVIYEVFSGSFPFKGLRNETSILLVRSGDHPCRPEGGADLGLTDELWNMMKACWKRRDRRWKISRIVSTLKCHSGSTVTAVGTEWYT